MKRSLGWSWLAVALLVAMIACDPGAFPDRLYREDFETLCEGVPCGWERTNGELTQATWVETIHPGEHGLRLDGQASVRGPGSELASDAIAVESLALVLTARCDPGSQLRFDFVLADELGGTFSASVVPDVEPEWSAPITSGLMTDGARGDVVRVVAVGIAKTGTGACEVSELVVDTRTFATGC